MRCVFASELAVGAKSRDATDRRDPDPTVDLREVTDDPPASFLAPMLPTVSVADSLDDCRVPTDDTFAELVRDNLLAAVPTCELGPERRLLRLVRVVPVLRMLFRLLLAVLKFGSGERERAEDAIDPLIDVPAVVALLWCTEGILLPVATVAVARAGAAADFFARPRDGGPIFSFSLPDSDFAAGAGFGILLGAGSAALPRFQTFWTRDLADDKNPNRDGLGLGFSTEISIS